MKNDQLEAIRLAAQAEFERSPKAGQWWSGALKLAVLNAGLVAVLLTVMSVHTEQHSSVWLRWAGALGFAAVGALGAFAAIRPGATSWRLGLLMATLVTMALVVLGASGFEGQPLWGGAACAVVELVASILPLAATLIALTQFAADPARAYVGGITAGSVGLLALHFACPIGSVFHLVCFHLVPWVLVGLAAVGVRSTLRSATFAP